MHVQAPLLRAGLSCGPFSTVFWCSLQGLLTVSSCFVVVTVPARPPPLDRSVYVHRL